MAWLELFTKFLLPFPLQLVSSVVLYTAVRTHLGRKDTPRSTRSAAHRAAQLSSTTSILVAINLVFLVCYAPVYAPRPLPFRSDRFPSLSLNRCRSFLSGAHALSNTFARSHPHTQRFIATREEVFSPPPNPSAACVWRKRDERTRVPRNERTPHLDLYCTLLYGRDGAK